MGHHPIRIGIVVLLAALLWLAAPDAPRELAAQQRPPPRQGGSAVFSSDVIIQQEASGLSGEVAGAIRRALIQRLNQTTTRQTGWLCVAEPDRDLGLMTPTAKDAVIVRVEIDPHR